MAAEAPARVTFLAATCPSSSSMYTRVAAGQDPNSNENGTAAAASDIAAYGCSETSGLGFFMLSSSDADSVFLDEGLSSAAKRADSDGGPTGAPTIFETGQTVYAPGTSSQTRRFSVSSYPTTITTRAAMPFLDLQCASDGGNSDNADGAGWNSQALGAGTQNYCIAYIWDGVPASTPTAIATATATATPVAPTVTPTASSPNARITVNFPGLSSVHVYALNDDGTPGTATGKQAGSATWQSDTASLTVPKGTYDLRVVSGPAVTIIDGVNCSADCTVDVPLATLSVTFPGLTSAHVYAHMTDGVPGTYGAQAGSSTWKDNSTSLVLLRGVYDIRVVHGPTTVVLDNIDCRTATCLAAVPLAKLTVSFPGLMSVHSYAHQDDGASGTYGAQDSSSTWKDNSTSMVLLQSTYDVRVVHGPMQTVFDAVDCRATTCSVTVPMSILTVNFPGLTSVHTYTHASDGAAGTYGAQDSSSTWKDDTISMTLLRGVYDVRVVHGPMTLVFDDVDCQGTTCVVDVPLATLTVNFPGLTSAHSYAHKSDGAAGTYGTQDSSSTWKDNTTSMILLQGVYDVRVVHGPMTTVLDDIDCRAATCVADVPLAALSVSFPGHTNVHTYVRADDNADGTATGAQDSSATWKSNGANFVLLRGYYDVLMVEGSAQYIVDGVDCRSDKCETKMPDKPVTTEPPKLPQLKKSFVSAKDGIVTWRLELNMPGDVLVWDAGISNCEEFGGASCGKLLGGGPAWFVAKGDRQYLLVTQKFEMDGESCGVKNTAEWAGNESDRRQSVTASYECSGAPTMGWELFGLFAAGAASMAWVVQRKFAWSR